MKRYYLSDGTTDLDALVDDGADLDGEFRATCMDTGDTLTVRGWMLTAVEELPL